jgi:hypothetical protein
LKVRRPFPATAYGDEDVVPAVKIPPGSLSSAVDASMLVALSNDATPEESPTWISVGLNVPKK